MYCIKPDCRQEIRAGLQFCPFCGAAQNPTQNLAGGMQPTPQAAPPPPRQMGNQLPPPQGTSGLGQQVRFPSGEMPQQPYTAARPSAAPPPNVPNVPTTSGKLSATSAVPQDVIVLRASREIWNVEEHEGPIKPGQRRPLLVLDEQTIHLAHTDRPLFPEELLSRVETIISHYGVPVDVCLSNTRWIRDEQELRPRLIASLRNHAYSDLKMILGVDYLGRWASLQMMVATEPEAIAAPPAPPQADFPIGPIIAISLGVLLLLAGVSSGFSGIPFIVLGMIAGIGGFFWLILSRGNASTKHQQQMALWQAELRKRETEKAIEKLSRTFKVDDIRLFCEAMQRVFQAVVDDIVTRGGAEVVRIEGGRGGFLQASGAEKAEPAARRTDAAQSGI